MAPAVFAVATISAPFVIVAAQYRSPWLRKINPIIIAYAFGLLLSLIIPHTEAVASVQDTVSTVTVIISIPLMLLVVDLRSWAQAGARALVSLGLAVVAVMTATFVAHLVFRDALDASATVGALLVGVYTGGTPNLAALRLALGVENSLYLTVHTVDLFVSAAYILLVLVCGRWFVRRFSANGIVMGFDRSGRRDRSEVFEGSSRRDRSFGDDRSDEANEDRSPSRAIRTGSTASFPIGTVPEEEVDFRFLIARGNRLDTLLSLGIAVVIVALSAGASFLVPPENRTVVTILLLTTFALAATLLPGVRERTGSFRLGEFFILIFSVTVGSMADISRIIATSPVVIGYMSIVVFGSLLVHFVLIRLFRIDPGTFLVTSISAICSPPFVGMLAPIVRDPRVIAAGITTGIVG
ncbi:MAG: DUF819 family protein, partial [Alkalispirochaeta sp.]